MLKRVLIIAAALAMIAILIDEAVGIRMGSNVAANAQQPKKADLELRLSAPKTTVKAGSDVYIKIEMTDTSDHPVDWRGARVPEERSEFSHKSGCPGCLAFGHPGSRWRPAHLCFSQRIPPPSRSPHPCGRFCRMGGTRQSPSTTINH